MFNPFFFFFFQRIKLRALVIIMYLVHSFVYILIIPDVLLRNCFGKQTAVGWRSIFTLTLRCIYIYIRIRVEQLHRNTKIVLTQTTYYMRNRKRGVNTTESTPQRVCRTLQLRQVRLISNTRPSTWQLNGIRHHTFLVKLYENKKTRDFLKMLFLSTNTNIARNVK